MMGPTAGLHQQASGRCLSANVLTGQTKFQQEVCHTRRGMAMSIPGPMDAPDKCLPTQPRNPRR